MDISFHYPPELLKLLTDAIPKLCKSKKDVLIFFRGAGVADHFLAPFELLLLQNKEGFNKYHVVRDLLVQINVEGETTLRERREILNRVVNFDDFSVCWPNDQISARGVVSQIRELVNVKDSFTRIEIERKKERQERFEVADRIAQQRRTKNEEFDGIKHDFYALFSEQNPWKRGKSLESVLNRYFAWNDILISEAITIKGSDGQGVIEQIDGVIRFREQPFLVEIKWEKENIGKDTIAPHLVRIFNRSLAGGIFISYSDYTEAAISDCRDIIVNGKAIALCRLEEFFQLFEKGKNLKDFLDKKIDAATIHKNPYLKLLL